MLAELLKSKFKCFRDYEASEVDSFLAFCEHVAIPSSEVLWTEGSGDNYAAFILDGNIGIKKKTEFDGKDVVVGIYTAGSVVGELCLLTDRPRTVTALALEPTDMVVLHNHKFEEMIQNHPLIGLRLLRYIFLSTSQRLTKSYERIASIF
jgi:CRP/FNR family transcriptional regulator, cyclic AMP receptor protein